MTIDYWRECVSIALDEAGVEATREQIDDIAGAVESGHDNYGQAYPTPDSPYKSELKTALVELKKEREKVFCWTCMGSGRITSQGPYHSSNSGCHKCGGEGKISL